MKITKIETLWFNPVAEKKWRRQHACARQAASNNLWVRIHTDDGRIGLGETYYQPRAVSAIIHDVFAELLIGRSPLDIENHWNNLFCLVNFCGFAGAEMRAISAIDIALWDLLGQHTGQPIYNLLGGRNRDRIGVYNTCIDSGKYADYTDTMNLDSIGEVAHSLLQQGIRAMKIWPFDQFGDTLAGPEHPREDVYVWGGKTSAGPVAQYLDPHELRQGLAYIERIRAEVGDEMAVAIEGHCRWNQLAGTQIARALEKYDNILWLEDVIRPDNTESLVRLKAETKVPFAVSERLFTRYGFRQIIERHAADVIMPDIEWCGGITEFRKICILADTYYLPVTSHDSIGPIALWAAAHVMMHIPNAMIMEAVRGYWDEGWYNDVTTTGIPIRDGLLTLPNTPGLGTALREELLARPDALIEITTEKDLKNRE